MVEHDAVIIVYGDSKVLVLFVALRPLDLMCFGTADGNYLSACHAVDKGVNMTFSL